MKPKMQSAIERITLNDATFTGEVIEPTFVNFFYGKNGAGKTTIARSLRDNTGIEWKMVSQHQTMMCLHTIQNLLMPISLIMEIWPVYLPFAKQI